MKQVIILLAVLFLAVIAVSAEEVSLAAKPEPKLNKEFEETRCLKPIKVTCRYVNVCGKYGNKCVEHATKKECTQWKQETTHKIEKQCAQWETTLKKATDPVCCKKTKDVKISQTKAVCAKHKNVKYCKKEEHGCLEHKLVKRCYRVSHPFLLNGPVSCKAGEQLKFETKDKTITRSCVKAQPVALRTCSSFLDPHTRTIEGKSLEFQVAGDYKFIETPDSVFLVHQRLHKYAHWSGTIGFAARVNGRDIVEYTQAKFLVNGHQTELKVNVPVKLPQGGEVLVRADAHGRRHVEVFSPNGAKLTFFIYHTHQGTQYGNLIAAIPASMQPTGYCSGKNSKYYLNTVVTGLFGVPAWEEYNEDVKPPAWKSPEAKRLAEERCKLNGFKGDQFEFCLLDMRMAGDAPGERQKWINIEKHVQKEIDITVKAQPL